MQPLSEGLVYLDEHLLVLEKPAGLLAVPGRGPDKQDCLSARAQQLWPDARVVHRLDMATSGLFLMARGDAMQRRLSALFEARAVDKRYVAVVAGHLAPPPGEWAEIDLPLAADWPRRPMQKIDAEHGRPSLTRWRVLGHDETAGTTRLEVAPVTGRSHQIRVHLQALGHPILGDALYAPSELRDRSPRLLLHAARLAFVHPAMGDEVAFESAPPF
ncbi:RluA family pseudouridine synthase [Ramlibacter sp.]|uniref:RluA family pseudouridine synthase n=1 Tax=Ramlibacter sp. TaxID=1917967 RepID=UPI0035B05EC5